MSDLNGEYYDKVRDTVVVVEYVPERSGYMTYEKHAPEPETNYPKESMLRQSIQDGRLVKQGAGRVPDARGESRVSGSDVPEDFDFSF